MAGEGPRDLKLPLLYGLTDVRYAASHAACAARLLAAGVTLVQVRDKSPAARALLASAREVVALGRARGAVVVVNDRPDVALLAQAGGVHLGEDDLPAEAARLVLGAGALIGVSTHSAAAAQRAMESEAASYVALGPLFPTESKEGVRAPLGLGAVAEAARGKTKPLVVIGGIRPEQVGECLRAGADCVAMIAGLLSGDTAGNVEEALASAARAGFS